jgi:hypothetical protein
VFGTLAGFAADPFAGSAARSTRSSSPQSGLGSVLGHRLCDQMWPIGQAVGSSRRVGTSQVQMDVPSWPDRSLMAQNPRGSAPRVRGTWSPRPSRGARESGSALPDPTPAPAPYNVLSTWTTSHRDSAPCWPTGWRSQGYCAPESQCRTVPVIPGRDRPD